jgi:hypothetical protein
MVGFSRPYERSAGQGEGSANPQDDSDVRKLLSGAEGAGVVNIQGPAPGRRRGIMSAPG